MPEPRAEGRFTVSIEVTIRPAVETDLPALEWLGLYSSHRHILREAFSAQQRGDGLMLLGVSGGFPIAQVFIDFARAGYRGRALLWAVRTFFPLHGRGIGRRMMAAAEEAMVARGMTEAELHVERNNIEVVRFYQRCGWHRAGEGQKRLTATSSEGAARERPAADVVVMEKTLVAPR